MPDVRPLMSSACILFPAVEFVTPIGREVIILDRNMSSAAVSAYSARSRASDRTGRIRDNINRSSAYILGNTDYTGSSRRPRDSSIGTMGRPTSALSRLVFLNEYATPYFTSPWFSESQFYIFLLFLYIISL